MSFQTLRRDDLLCYQSNQIHAPHGFTTRLGGVSTGHLASMNLGLKKGDTVENIQENFQRLGQAIGFAPEKTVFSAQVHRDDIKTVAQQDWGKGLITPTDYDADGLITNVPGTTLVVFSADCGTVLLEDRHTGAVGACHAGWRGTALGIAGKTVERMCRDFGCDPKHIHAALGPCISRCCFETDGDVPEAMMQALGDEALPAIEKHGKKYHVDLKYLNRLFLQRAGVPEDNIDVTQLCTCCDPDTFWSHRIHGDRRGSLGAIIVAGGAK